MPIRLAAMITRFHARQARPRDARDFLDVTC
jgi:hypothetical protein